MMMSLIILVSYFGSIKTSLFECIGNITGSQDLSNLFIYSGQNMSGFSVGNEVRIVLLSF